MFLLIILLDSEISHSFSLLLGNGNLEGEFKMGKIEVT